MMIKRFLAAIQFFTRLPVYKWTRIPAENFKQVVPYWPWAGWVTAFVSVLVLLAGAFFFSPQIAVLLAMAARLLLTGCLHEDGLADFFDGFGGGRNREQILAIMKDSHIGTYGVVGLIFYFAACYLLLTNLPIEIAGVSILMGDPLSKGISAFIIKRLPYARREEEAKNKLVYAPMTQRDYGVIAVGALLPLCLLPSPYYLVAVLFPVAAWFGLTGYMKKKINGYTGDCCGALCLLCELSFYFGLVLVYKASFTV